MPKSRTVFSVAIAVTALILSIYFMSVSKKSSPVYLNKTLTAEKRAGALLGKMTLEEKVAQLQIISRDILEKNIVGVNGIGTLGNSGMAAPIETARKAVRIHNFIKANTRLGIPPIILSEALHGLTVKGADSFPQAIGLAATFDDSLMKDVSSVIAEQTRTLGYRQVLTPVVNIARDVRWGRTEETYGEDPYLSSRMGAAFCRSFTDKGVIATPKHFVANFGDGGRDSNSAQPSERLLRDIYFPPFYACINEGGALSVMPAFNSLDGRPCNANKWLLSDILRKEWSFKGFTISDADALDEIVTLHHVALDKEDAAKQALSAGLDVELHEINVYGEPLMKAIKNGDISENTVNKAVRRVLETKFTIGLFDEPFVDSLAVSKVFESKKTRELALNAARKAIVLLKNENSALPLKKDIKRIAVIGPKAGTALLGGYSRETEKGVGMLVDYNVKTTKTAIVNDNKFRDISILEGIKNKVSSGTSVVYEIGTNYDGYALPPVPASYFSQEDGKKGLKGEYFNNKNLEGKPSVIRTEKNIDFDWGGSSPDSSIANERFSARWTGCIVSPVTGKVKFSITSGDGVRFRFGGKLLFESWEDRRETTDFVTVKLEKGKSYDIEMEFYENKWGAAAHLGWDYGFNESLNIRKAAELAKNSDAAVIVATIKEGEFFDRACLDLPGYQERLIKEVAASGKPTVVVLVNGSAVTMENWLDDVSAVVEAWYPGEEGGNAVADVLFGDYNPAGRLPVTFPRSSMQLPLYYNYIPSGRGYDYTDMSAQPRFPFGYGLSYTTFEYGKVELSAVKIKPDGKTVVSVEVKNSGETQGDEVVQLYIRDVVSSVARPVKELKKFRRINLGPGEIKKVSFTIGPEELSMYDLNMKKIVEPGVFEIMIGASSLDIRQKVALEVVAP